MMPYGFAQRVVRGDPDEVLRAARRAASRRGMVTGPIRRTAGVLRERYLPVADARTTGRLWAWPIARGLTVTYLGLEAGSLAGALSPAIRRRLFDEAHALLEDVGAGPVDAADARLAA